MSKSKQSHAPRCEGYRRYGGAFTLGPVKWEQCRETATVLLKVKQDGEIQSFPACHTCWNEALTNKGITVVEAKPLVASAAQTKRGHNV